jgi:coenzyme F420-reducing hydrogenase beta subunit
MVQIENKADCCGCTACCAICNRKALRMEADSEGFYYPVGDISKCNDCGVCEKVCPISNHKNLDKKPLAIYGAKNKIREKQYKSSSGGVFMELAEYIISRNGIVFGATYSDSFEVKHQKAITVEECLAFRGSKYVQSNLLETFREVKQCLEESKPVLFSGTPCQIAGLRNYLRKQYDNLITVDLICHQVPSPLIFNEYIKHIENKFGKTIKSINMKDKEKGWGQQKTRIIFQDDTMIFNKKESNLWQKIYYSLLVTRPSCHECKFANLQRPGDITIGDYVFIEKHFPDFHDKNGVSVVLINNDKGFFYFKQAEDKFYLLPTTAEQSSQPMLEHSFPESPRRSRFWQDYYNHGFTYTINKYFRDDSPSLILIVTRKIKKILKKGKDIILK